MEKTTVLPNELGKVTDLSLLETAEQTVDQELQVLDKIIDYANDWRGYDPRYNELRLYGYGKSVTFRKEDGTEETFRVPQAHVTCPVAGTGYATPGSPMGRLCTIVQVGDERHSPKWGHFEVVEIRNFTRFEGQASEDNIRNFRSMYASSLETLYQVLNLRKTLDTLRAFRLAGFGKLAPAVTPAPVVTPAPPEELTELEFEEEDLVAGELEDSEEQVYLNPDEEQTEYFGLSEYFYLNRTVDQDAAISRSPRGPFVVEGIAGSGKTSVALGRMKTLCNYRPQEMEDSAFRMSDFFDKDEDEAWSGVPGDFFAEASSVGFVRTGELLIYLSTTCARLGLPNLPIKEYRDFQHELCTQRELHNSRYTLLPPEEDQPYAESSMKWLHATDEAIARLLLQTFHKPGEAIQLQETGLMDASQDLLQWEKILRQEWEKACAPVAGELQRRLPGRKPFLLHGIVAILQQTLSRFRDEFLSRGRLWVKLDGQWQLFATRDELANFLLNHHPVLFDNHKRRLVFGRPHLKALLAQGAELQLEDGTNIPADDDEQIEAALIKDNVRIKDKLGLFRARQIDKDDLIVILAGGTPLAQLQDGKLRRLYIQDNLPLQKRERRTRKDDERETNLRAVVTRQLRSYLFRPLQFIDLYRQALEEEQLRSLWPELNLAEQVRQRLRDKALASHDIDLLLCLAHIMAADCDDPKVRSRLRQPASFFRTVFIDEVQDFTEQQVFLMAHQAHPRFRAVTVVGDLYQQLTAGKIRDLEACFPYDGDLPRILLKENKRQEREPALMALSQLFRADVQGDTRLTMTGEERQQFRALIETSPAIQLLEGGETDQVREAIFEVVSQQPRGRTVAVILPTQAEAEQAEQSLRNRLLATFRHSYASQSIDLTKKYLVHFTSPRHVKGLEFDTVVLAGLEHFDWNNPQVINSVYVVLSRPRKRLCIITDPTRLPKHVQDFLPIQPHEPQ